MNLLIGLAVLVMPVMLLVLAGLIFQETGSATVSAPLRSWAHILFPRSSLKKQADPVGSNGAFNLRVRFFSLSGSNLR